MAGVSGSGGGVADWLRGARAMEGSAPLRAVPAHPDPTLARMPGRGRGQARLLRPPRRWLASGPRRPVFVLAQHGIAIGTAGDLELMQIGNRSSETPLEKCRATPQASRTAARRHAARSSARGLAVRSGRARRARSRKPYNAAAPANASGSGWNGSPGPHLIVVDANQTSARRQLSRSSRLGWIPPMREDDLYPPIKAFLEAQGYAVKAEVGDCDVVAIRSGEPPVIVELKTSFPLPLIPQGIARQVPSRTFRAANSVVVPLRRSSWVIRTFASRHRRTSPRPSHG